MSEDKTNYLRVTGVHSTPKRTFRPGLYEISESLTGDRYVTSAEADRLVAAGVARRES